MPLALSALVVAIAIERTRGEHVSAGPIRVPNLVGMRNPTAEEALARRKLRWRFEGSDRVRGYPLHGPGVSIEPFDSDWVTEQAPEPGAMVARGTIVVLETRCLEIAREGDRACL